MNKNQIAETVTKSALNLIPGVGGAIASILGDYLSIRKEARLNEFIKNYFDEINQKQDCIVREYVCSDDFLDIFENILADVMQSRTELKRDMLKNLLVNSCTIPHTTYERTEEFQHLIDVLSPLSLQIFKHFYYLVCRNTIQRTCRLVCQNYFRVIYQCSCYCYPLLLPS